MIKRTKKNILNCICFEAYFDKYSNLSSKKNSGSPKISEPCSYNDGYEAFVYYCKATNVIKDDKKDNVSDYVFDYDLESKSFPHTSTTIQWYSFERFEAYRLLGNHIGRELVESIKRDRNDNYNTIETKTIPVLNN